MVPRKGEIVIIGGGIMGCSTAYYLSLTPAFKRGALVVTLVESNAVASAASGYAGGFLARDWHGKETAALGLLSYALHRDLAEQYDGSKAWGYTSTTPLSLTASCLNDTGSKASVKSEWLQGLGGVRVRCGRDDETEDDVVPEDFDWIDVRHVTGVSSMDTETAQINPLKFTCFLAQKCVEAGVDMVIGSVDSIVRRDGTVEAIVLRDGRRIACDKVLLAAGPWTGLLHEMLFPQAPKVPIAAFAGTSLLLQTDKAHLSAYAAFGAVTMGDGDVLEVEFFGREDGQIWIGGVNDHSALPEDSKQVFVEPVNVEKLKQVSRILFGNVSVTRESKCYRPINVTSTDRMDVPIMQETERGVYVCAGHSVWGITLGPGSGMIMSQMMTGSPLQCDISGLQR